ncbi:hypothetical protein WAI453_001030 [Rhynchosporium graminicola]
MQRWGEEQPINRALSPSQEVGQQIVGRARRWYSTCISSEQASAGRGGAGLELGIWGPFSFRFIIPLPDTKRRNKTTQWNLCNTVDLKEVGREVLAKPAKNSELLLQLSAARTLLDAMNSRTRSIAPCDFSSFC